MARTIVKTAARARSSSELRRAGLAFLAAFGVSLLGTRLGLPGTAPAMASAPPSEASGAAGLPDDAAPAGADAAGLPASSPSLDPQVERGFVQATRLTWVHLRQGALDPSPWSEADLADPNFGWPAARRLADGLEAKTGLTVDLDCTEWPCVLVLVTEPEGSFADFTPRLGLFWKVLGAWRFVTRQVGEVPSFGGGPGCPTCVGFVLADPARLSPEAEARAELRARATFLGLALRSADTAVTARFSPLLAALDEVGVEVHR